MPRKSERAMKELTDMHLRILDEIGATVYCGSTLEISNLVSARDWPQNTTFCMSMEGHPGQIDMPYEGLESYLEQMRERSSEKDGRDGQRYLVTLHEHELHTTVVRTVVRMHCLGKQ